VSRNTSIGEQRINERCVRPHELAALDSDEALIFARRGEMHRALCPQPETLPGVSERIQGARALIAGNRKLLA